MAPERNNFNLSGPKHLKAVDWTNEDHRRSVAACLVQGVYVVEGDLRKKRKDSQALASPWWESFHFQMLELLEDDSDSSIFGAIYKFEFPASHSNLSIDGCPCYVIAFRGTILKRKSLERDIKLNLRIIRNALHLDPRFKKAMQAVRSKANLNSSNVWLAGHSLGSAIALLAGKTMAKEGIFLETFLFNLPYPSVPIEKITHEKVMHVIRGAGNAFRAALVLAMKKKFGELPKAWAPCLFVNPADFICSKYDEYFEHKKKMEKFGLGGIERLATQFSLRGLIIGNESEPMHRIPSAYLTVNLTGYPDFKQAHGINQWWSHDLHLKSKLYISE
ncbi:hypothetical protein LWI28_020248 [Acer negundo]|uniref:Fungal lipase-type domain-containing protein n=1 Tax=Acer negundo TaxID=4023 RepID=A0AAD5IWV7_ACENE|nr:hypothetical protein LWI28_020248 [Acer negundo]KAK4843092.1 hypothetical protein QYF36_003949 [Acer negundo]